MQIDWKLYLSARSLREALGRWAKTLGVGLYMPERLPTAFLEVVELQITLETEEPKSWLARFLGRINYTGKGELNQIILHRLGVLERADIRMFLPPGILKAFTVELRLGNEATSQLLELLNALCYLNWAEIISGRGQPKSVVLREIQPGDPGTVKEISIELE